MKHTRLIYNDKRVYFVPKPNVMPYINRLMQSPINEVEMPSVKASSLFRYKEMRYLRDKKLIKPFRDGMGTSLIKCKPMVKIKKNGKGYDFLF